MKLRDKARKALAKLEAEGIAKGLQREAELQAMRCFTDFTVTWHSVDSNSDITHYIPSSGVVTNHNVVQTI